MEKLNKNQFEEALQDVRKSYRLLALYQQRLIDIIKYVGNRYEQELSSGWAKYSKPVANGNRAKLDALGWDWLTLYLYQFDMGHFKIGEDTYYFNIIHQADTGYDDKMEQEKISKQEVDKYCDAASSETRLFFILSKNDNGWPIDKFLKPHLSSKTKNLVKNENWLAIPFELHRFLNQDSTNRVIEEFNLEILRYFNVNLMESKESLVLDKTKI